MIGKRTAFAALTAIAASVPAHAAVTISTAVTQNMTCLDGVCAPTATEAVLNVGDLENLLASSNVAVTTTGAGVESDNLVVSAGLSWSNSNSLTFDAHDSVSIFAPVSITGVAGLFVVTNDGGKNGVFSIASGGYVTFANLSSTLNINNESYTLENSIAALAIAMAGNSQGRFALANSYDASADGTYSSSPIANEFLGKFDGLGNTISNLSIDAVGTRVAAFIYAADSGSIEHLLLTQVSVADTTKTFLGAVGGLTGGTGSQELLFQDFVSGTVVGGNKYYVGELAGSNEGRILESSASGAVVGGSKSYVGGLVGMNECSSKGTDIEESFANAAATGGRRSNVGGLAGGNSCIIGNSYSTGAVAGGEFSNAGGLIGYNADTSGQSLVRFSYENGSVKARVGGFRGGFVGEDLTFGGIRASYWDTTTTGLKEGAGNVDESGMKGRTTTQFMSRLPLGFNTSIWGQDSGINNGFPYLLANPPPN